MTKLGSLVSAAKVVGARSSGAPRALNASAAQSLKRLVEGYHQNLTRFYQHDTLDPHVQTYFRTLVTELPAEVRNGVTLPEGSFSPNTLRLALEKLRPLATPPAGAAQSSHHTTTAYELGTMLLGYPAGFRLRYHQEQSVRKFLDSLPPQQRNGAALSDKGFAIENKGWVADKLIRVETPDVTAGSALEALTAVRLSAE